MKTLDAEIRRRIVCLLREGELSAGEIARRLHRRRPGLSHHLYELMRAGVLECRSVGSFRYYRLDAARALAAWDEYLALAPRSHVVAP